MPARYLRHLAVERPAQTFTLTVQATTRTAAQALKQAQKPLAATTITVAAVSSLKVKLLTVAAASTVAGALVKQVRLTRSAASTIGAGLSKLVRVVRGAATTLRGIIVQGASPAVVTVTVSEATFVNVTVGPL